MTTLSRRNRLAAAAGSGARGRLYFGDRLVWPTNSPVQFELFAPEHPYSSLRTGPSDDEHFMRPLFEWDGDLLVGYGGLNSTNNQTYLPAINPATGAYGSLVYTLNNWGLIGVSKYTHGGTEYLLGLCPEGYADFMWATVADGFLGPVPHLFTHTTSVTGHDGYLWVAGQTKYPTLHELVIWRTPIDEPEGVGEELLRIRPANSYANRAWCAFSYGGKFWYQRERKNGEDAAQTYMTYWDETTDEWVETGINFGNGYGYGPYLSWHGLMWSSAFTFSVPFGIWSFNGTAWTSRGPGLQQACIGSDDALYAIGSGGSIWRTEDGDDWVNIGGVSGARSIYVEGDQIYVGGSNDEIWRGELGSWGGT